MIHVTVSLPMHVDPEDAAEVAADLEALTRVLAEFASDMAEIDVPVSISCRLAGGEEGR